MGQEAENPQGGESEIPSNVRVGYQVAVNLVNHEEQQMWARSNAMLVANCLIVAALGLSLEKHTKLWNTIPLLLIMSLAGIVLCYVWWCLIARTAIKATNWVKEAHKLEKKLCPTVRTLERGDIRQGERQ